MKFTTPNSTKKTGEKKFKKYLPKNTEMSSWGSNSGGSSLHMSFEQFLNTHRTDDKGCITHNSLTHGKYLIPENEIDIFYKLYNKHVFKDKKDAFLVEKHEDIGPILIDLDFKWTI